VELERWKVTANLRIYERSYKFYQPLMQLLRQAAIQGRGVVSGLAMAIVLTAAGLAFIGCATKETSSLVASDWRPLFDGRSIDGWRQIGPGKMRVENGELVTDGGMALLWYSREKFSNCQIRVVFKLSATNDNGGVFIRIPNPPRDEWDAVNGGYEVQIDDHGDLWHRTGCLYSFTKAQNKVFANVGTWNEMVITLFGPRTRVSVNGVPVTDYTEGDPVPAKYQPYEPDRAPRPIAGFIGVQNHDTNTHVRFKFVGVRAMK
jgi:hypothetical protein